MDDKRVIVTGGASGIGRCIVEILIKKGAQVGVFDIDSIALNNLEKSYPGVHGFICDVSDSKQVEQAVESFYKKFDRIDILINNAGIINNYPLIGIEDGKFVKHDNDHWDKTIKINLYSVFYATREVVLKMIEKRTHGVIINISSIAASGNAGQSAYSAAKAGVRALTVAWAKELGFWNIRVASIAPGLTKTESLFKSTKEDILDGWRKKTPLNRIAEPKEIVDGIVFIINNDFFNGRLLELDGGLRI